MCRALAREVSTKGGKGVEPAIRITYDDANECFVLPQNVRRIIRDLGGCVAPVPFACICSGDNIAVREL